MDDASRNSAIEQDFENAWFWYFHRLLAHILSSGQLGPIDNELAAYSAFLLALDPEPSPPVAWRRWIPRLRDGKFRLKAGPNYARGELQGKIEFNDPDGITFGAAVRHANQLLTKINSKAIKPLVIFMDEIEVSFGTLEQYYRDCRIIRDLVIVISRLTETFLERGLPIQIIAGIRSEIVNAVSVLGKEINKATSDFGIGISWHGRDESLSHSLFDIVAQKIRASERRRGVVPATKDVWSRYFPRTVGKDEFWKFAISRSWYRPRDFVRRLNLTKDKALERDKNSSVFTEQDFRRSNKEYSTQSWVELTEELQARYSNDEIAGIKQIFTGYSSNFMLSDLEIRIQSISQTYPKAKFLLSHDIAVLVEDLYRVGLIGNNYYDSGGKQGRGHHVDRWAFRGDDDVILERRFAVHRGLWATLSVTTETAFTA